MGVFRPDPFGQAEGLFRPGDHLLPVAQEAAGVCLGLSRGCCRGHSFGQQAALVIRDRLRQPAVQPNDPADVLGDALDRLALGHGRSNVGADGGPGLLVYFNDQLPAVLKAPIPGADRLRSGDRCESRPLFDRAGGHAAGQLDRLEKGRLPDGQALFVDLSPIGQLRRPVFVASLGDPLPQACQNGSGGHGPPFGGCRFEDAVRLPAHGPAQGQGLGVGSGLVDPSGRGQAPPGFPERLAGLAHFRGSILRA